MLKNKIRNILDEEIIVNFSGDIEGLDDAVKRINDLFQTAADEMVKAVTSKKKLNIYGDGDAMKQAVKKIDVYDPPPHPDDWGDFSTT